MKSDFFMIILKFPSLVPFLIQTNPIHILPFYFVRTHLNINVTSTTKYAKCFFLQSFSPKYCMLFSLVPFVPHIPPILFAAIFISWQHLVNSGACKATFLNVPQPPATSSSVQTLYLPTFSETFPFSRASVNVIN